MKTKILKERLNQSKNSEPAVISGIVATSTAMNPRGLLVVGFLLLVTLHARAVAIYDWVPKNNDGSSGQIVLRDDTTIFDPEHPGFRSLPAHDNQLASFTFTFGITAFSGGPGESGGLMTNGSMLTPDSENVFGRLIYYLQESGSYLIFQIADAHTTVYPSPGGLSNALFDADGTWTYKGVADASVPDVGSTGWLLGSVLAVIGLAARHSRKLSKY